MRYTGGLLGGSWLTALTGDLGNGKFDGAWLVSNFENLNPANTSGRKHYNLYSKVDSEAPRYLEFEQWWGGHVLLNAEEMQFIVDELFVGNKLAAGEIVTSRRHARRSAQHPLADRRLLLEGGQHHAAAAGAGLDPRPLRERRRHPRPRPDHRLRRPRVDRPSRHLRIRLGSKEGARRVREQHRPHRRAAARPLRGGDDAQGRGQRAADLVGGDYLVRFEARTLDDIRALGGNDEEDDRKFATVARVSEINLGLYRTFVQPWVRAWANEGFAEWMRELHPAALAVRDVLRRQSVHAAAAVVRRRTFARTGSRCQATMHSGRRRSSSRSWIETSLDAYRDVRDDMSEATVPCDLWLARRCRRWSGSKLRTRCARAGPAQDAAHLALVARRIEELQATAYREGGPREAAIRALLYIRMPEGAVDERGFNLLRRMREEAGRGLTLGEFKRLVREQFFMLLLDERRAVEAIPAHAREGSGPRRAHASDAAADDRSGRAAQRAMQRLGWPRSRPASSKARDSCVEPSRAAHLDRVTSAAASREPRARSTERPS